MRCCLLGFVFFMLAGCTTPTAYGPNGLKGGYSEDRLASDTWAVKAEGNVYSTKSRMLDIAMMRAAELTIENGFVSFEVTGGDGAFIKTWNWTNPGHSVSNGTADTYYSNGVANTHISNTTTHYPASHSSADFPEANVIVKMYKKSGAPKNAYDAESVIKNIKPRFSKIKGQGAWVRCQDKSANKVFETSSEKCNGPNLVVKEML